MLKQNISKIHSQYAQLLQNGNLCDHKWQLQHGGEY